MEPRVTQHATRITNRALGLFVVALSLSLLSRALLYAQPSQPIEGSNFKGVGEFFDPPNERQMKSFLESSRWRHQGTQTVLNDARVQTFRTNGTVELIIDAPECFYDETRKAINSSGPVRFRTADGRFSLQGVGFLWLQTNLTLYISNQVQTLVLSELLQTNAPVAQTNLPTKETKGVRVYSDRFEYSRNSGIGIYRGNVRAVGTNVNFRAKGEVMEVLVPEHERQLQTITMHQNVVLDYGNIEGTENIEATGEKALYTAATGLATVTGNPAWHDDHQRQGRGDELVIDQTNRIFHANGNGWVKMPRQSSGAPGLLSSATNSAAGTNQFIEVFSDHYEFRTNSADFGDHVIVLDTENGQTNGTLTSATLLVTLAGTNELESMVAEKNVVFQSEDKQFMGEKAVYTATNSLLRLTGNPAWRDGARKGNGELLVANLQRGEMRVFTNAFMRVPAREFGPTTMGQGAGASPDRNPGKAGNAPKTESPPAVSTQEKVEGNFSPLPVPEEQKKSVSPPVLGPTVPEFADIFSESYTLTTNTAHFEGGVRIIHPRVNWICQTMNVESPNPKTKDVTMVAEQAVEFTLKSGTNSNNGEDVHGTCDRAVYNYAVTPAGTNDTMTLTGKPILETTNSVITNSIIIVDCANNKLTAPGQYGIHGTTIGSPISTNALHFPTSHRKK